MSVSGRILSERRGAVNEERVLESRVSEFDTPVPPGDTRHLSAYFIEGTQAA